MKLRAAFEQLAQEFAFSVLRALRNVPAEEIGEGLRHDVVIAATTGARLATSAAGSAGRGGKRVRRSAEDIGKTGASIVALLEKHRSGLQAPEIRSKLRIEKKDLAKPILDLLATKKIVKSGEKRATIYFAR